MPPYEVLRVCLKTGDETAWREFCRRFHPLISRVVLRVAYRWGETSQQVIDDLIQETYLKLCTDGNRLLENFKPSHEDAIFGYLKVFTANLVSDHFKTRNSKKRGGAIEMACVDDLEPSRSGSDSAKLDRQILIQEVDACLRDVTTGLSAERDRRIFWLYYRIGLTAGAIAGLPTVDLTTKGVESTLLRLTRQIRGRLTVSRKKIQDERSVSEGFRAEESF